MRSTAINIKEHLRGILEKEGSTLQHFEAALSLTKQADAGALGSFIATKFAPNAIMAAALASAAAGIGGGLVGYQGYKQLQDSDDKKDGMFKQKQQYEDAISRLGQLTTQPQH